MSLSPSGQLAVYSLLFSLFLIMAELTSYQPYIYIYHSNYIIIDGSTGQIGWQGHLRWHLLWELLTKSSKTASSVYGHYH